MKAVYDLRACPATHDFCNFLAYAELERRKSRADAIDVEIVLGLRSITSRDKLLTQERRTFGSRDLLPQLAWLVPSVRSVSFREPLVLQKDQRFYESFGESTFRYKNLGTPPGIIFEASPYARAEVANYLIDKPRPVSISLRDSRFEPTRNSDLAEWQRVTVWLSKQGYTPIIVPDLRDALTGTRNLRKQCWSRFEQYPAASLHADFALALYEQCHMNLMVNFGRMLLCLMGRARVMAFKIVSDTIEHNSPERMEKSGFAPNVSWGEHKHIFWAPDQADLIIPTLATILPSLPPTELAPTEPAKLTIRRIG